MLKTFLERDESMLVLDEAVARASKGGGSNVLISGEAGIGKSTLVERFASVRRDRCKVLIGGCETLTTPRPLGPLCDVAAELGDHFPRLFRDKASPARIFQQLIITLARSSQPTFLVFEDIHWADHATLDLIMFLARRSAQLPLIFVLTYRTEDLNRTHPLRAVLGAMPPTATSWLRLLPLSRDAVDEICRLGQVKYDNLYSLTLGNPFLVSIFVDATRRPQADLMDSLQSVVKLRLAHLPAAAQTLCELASVVPGCIETAVLRRALAEVIADEFATLMDQCLTTGMLEIDDKYVRFRHEIFRRAIEVRLSPSRAQSLNAAIYRALLEVSNVDAARLVHHACSAHLDEQVSRLAPLAAGQARRLGARHEALTNYRRALNCIDRLPAAIQAEVLEGWAVEAAALNWPDEEVYVALQRAAGIWKEIGEIEKAGGALRWLAFAYWIAGRFVEGAYIAGEALTLLESIPPSATLAITCCLKIKELLAVARHEQAIAMARRAIAISESLGDQEALSQAKIYLGAAMLCGQQAAGKEIILEGIALGQKRGFFDATCDGYHILIEVLLKQGMLLDAERRCSEALAYAGQFDISTTYLSGLQSQVHGMRGHYAIAEASARKALASMPRGADYCRRPALRGLGTALSRAGRKGAIDVVRDLHRRELKLGFAQDILSSAPLLAEALSFAGKFDEARKVLLDAWVRRSRVDNPWIIGSMLVWAARLNINLPGVHQANLNLAPPLLLELQQQHREAADAWAALGAPFEQAVCLMRCGPDEVLQAIEVFREIGASVALGYARSEARRFSLHGVKRGPYRLARENPEGLTGREAQVLQLLCSGLHNRQIAKILMRSERTIEHHVSALLGKTGTHSRAALMTWAFRHPMNVAEAA